MTKTQNPVKFLSEELGDIVISVGNNEYPIDYIDGTEIINQDYGFGSHEPVSIRCNVIGNLKLGSYLTTEEIKSFKADIGGLTPFNIKIRDGRTYHNCIIRSSRRPYENIFEFSGRC